MAKYRIERTKEDSWGNVLYMVCGEDGYTALTETVNGRQITHMYEDLQDAQTICKRLNGESWNGKRSALTRAERKELMQLWEKEPHVTRQERARINELEGLMIQNLPPNELEILDRLAREEG